MQIGSSQKKKRRIDLDGERLVKVLKGFQTYLAIYDSQKWSFYAFFGNFNWRFLGFSCSEEA